jgi:hypothetical protein
LREKDKDGWAPMAEMEWDGKSLTGSEVSVINSVVKFSERSGTLAEKSGNGKCAVSGCGQRYTKLGLYRCVRCGRLFCCNHCLKGTDGWICFDCYRTVHPVAPNKRSLSFGVASEAGDVATKEVR